MDYGHLNEILSDLGYGMNEISVFTALFTLRVALASEVARQSGVTRPHVYVILKKFQKSGLVTVYEENKKLYFTTTGIEVLENLLEEKEKQFNKHRANLQTIKEDMQNDREGVKLRNSHVSFFEGKTAVRQILNDMLRLPPGEIIYDIEASHHYFNTEEGRLHEDDFRAFARRRIEKKIKVRCVTTVSPDIGAKLKKEQLSEYTDAVYIPQPLWDIPLEFGSYGNKVYLFTFEKIPIGVIVENPHFAKAFRILFKQFRAWALSLPTSKHISEPDRCWGSV